MKKSPNKGIWVSGILVLLVACGGNERKSYGGPKLDSRVAKIQEAFNSGGLPQAKAKVESMGRRLQQGGLQVKIEVIPGKEDEVIKAIEQAGGIYETRYKQFLQVQLPVHLLGKIAENPDIVKISLPVEAIEDSVPCESQSVCGQGAAKIGATNWQENGFDGTGVKVGILDEGFLDWGTAPDLPALDSNHKESKISWPNNNIDGSPPSQHGTKVAEIINDIAPGAELFIVNVNTDTEFCNAVEWLISKNVQVINSSGDFMGKGIPYDGTGMVDDCVTDAKNSGIFWVNSSGNYGNSHWSGNYFITAPDYYLEFATGVYSNPIYLNQGEIIRIHLLWDDPWGFTCNDYDLELYYETNPNPVDESNDFQWCAPWEHPEEYIEYQADDSGYYHIKVKWSVGFFDRYFDLYVDGPINTPTYHTPPSRSVVAPADSPSAFSVGATHHSDDALLSYSSQGPTRAGLLKPDLTAPTHVETYLTPIFTGTSASAPHVTGAAALVKQRYSSYNADTIAQYLKDNAIPKGSPSPNNQFGYGRLNLPAFTGQCLNPHKEGSDLRVTSNASSSGSPSLSWTGSEFGVSWTDNRDGNYEIYFARVSSAGTKIGSDVRISSATLTSSAPSLAWTGSEFGVSWLDGRNHADSAWDVYFVRISSAGAKIGSDTRITSTADAEAPSLVWTGSEFAVSWFNYSVGEIYFDRISSSGAKLGSDVRITSMSGSSEYPSLAWSGSEFGVSWQDYGPGNAEIYFARISSSGSKLGSDLRVTSAANYSLSPSLSWTGSEFGVSWVDGRDGNYEIYFARISASGAKIGSDVRITYAANNSMGTSLVWTGTEYGVSWTDERDGNYEIYFARISAGGVKQGSDVRITSNSNSSENPSLAWTGSEFGVSWYDYRDGNYEIYFARIGCCMDADTDGYYPLTNSCSMGNDCNDSLNSVHPGATEVCNGIDDDCDGLIDEGLADFDYDGYTAPGACSGSQNDCNDSAEWIYPGAPEILCNGADENCNGLADDNPNQDGDGYSVCSGDCNDWNSSIYPGASEIICDGLDQNCNGLQDDNPNADGDPVKYCNGDCDDNDPGRYPGNAETLCDGIDQNCNGLGDDDRNLDGDPVSFCGGDCDDNDPARYPGNPEVRCDGIDNDCNLATLDDPDEDGDGLSYCNEIGWGTSDNDPDTDDDGLNDGLEVFTYWTDPNNPDSDGDGLNDGAEVFIYFTEPWNWDTDWDGLNDGEEILSYGTNPLNPDTDGDGMADGWEGNKSSCVNPLVGDSMGNPDGDAFTNLEEFNNATDPCMIEGATISEIEPNDTPGQCQPIPIPSVITGEVNGSFDYYCVELASPMQVGFDIDASMVGSELDSYLRLYDTDQATILASNDDNYDPETGWYSLDSYLVYNFVAPGTYYIEVASCCIGTGWPGSWYRLYIEPVGGPGDSDGDGLTDSDEILIYLTNRFDPDTDGDGLVDGWDEVLNFGTNPLNPDTDNDGATDSEELKTYLTDPLNPDTDGDLMFDGWEIAGASCGLDPLFIGDALLDSDTDGLENIHEFFNNNGDGNVSEPCDDTKPRRGAAGGGYFGDGDGNLLIGVPDLNRINLILNGRSADYSNAFPADPLIQDLDGNLLIGVPDKNLISLILNGKLTDYIAGTPTELTLVAPLSPPTVAVGDTVRIQVKLTNGKDNPSAGFGVAFTIVSGAGALLGGEGISGPGRYDLTALNGVAQLVVRADGSGAILVQVALPYDPEVHTMPVPMTPDPNVEIIVGP